MRASWDCNNKDPQTVYIINQHNAIFRGYKLNARIPGLQ